MKRIFLYEFVTGGGWFDVDPRNPPGGSLLREGTAMLRAAMEDFSQLDDVSVITLRDQRLGELDFGANTFVVKSAEDERKQFRLACQMADAALVIAPEFDGHLLARTRAAQSCGVRLLSPAADFVALTADKHRTTELLSEQGVPVPCGTLLKAGQTAAAEFPFPAVVKPIDGAGSLETHLVESAAELECLGRGVTPRRLEKRVPGQAVSVSVICGTGGRCFLPPCRQHLSNDGRFRYLGGMCPLPEGLAHRATRLARAALQALPATVGYVGVDLVLGHPADGSGDAVIEINPRLTTSYVGIRAAVRESLAELVLQAARGGLPDSLSAFRKVEFIPDGCVSEGKLI